MRRLETVWVQSTVKNWGSTSERKAEESLAEVPDVYETYGVYKTAMVRMEEIPDEIVNVRV